MAKPGTAAITARTGLAMDTAGTIVTWVQEAWNVSFRPPYDLRLWGILFAVLVLAYVFSIARSLRRLNRRLSSAATELEEIRSVLRGIERRLEQSRTKASPPSGENQGIWDLPLREGKNKP